MEISESASSDAASPSTPLVGSQYNSVNQFCRLTNKFQSLGLAGVLSYAFLNLCYYLGTFLVLWLYVIPSPGGLGFIRAVKRVVEVLAIVWAGGEVTKLLRLAGALILAPFFDRVLNWFTGRFGFDSRGKAFGLLILSGFTLAFMALVTVTLLWS
ncbi:hypothetical protein O6H91_09G071600 [Diphasiastrum complanatum]|uniref:Uncharacterized protein n=1 Tax=Diphasiastrum complanatum TaxID=34168 RepID=A0ACC2CQR3_DIPCM|nr:hypothetical protein O6H91_09G071600 [Diphasiastrum complanatum]